MQKKDQQRKTPGSLWLVLGLGAIYIAVLAFISPQNVWMVLPIYGLSILWMLSGNLRKRHSEEVVLEPVKQKQKEAPGPQAEQGLPVVCIAYVDDFESVLSRVSEAMQSTLIAEINRCIADMAHQVQGVYRRFERDKYILCFERGRLKQLEEERFSVLDKVRAIKFNLPTPVTLSLAIGVGNDSENSNDLAMQAMEMALGRGGDQAVIKHSDGSYVFYGGRTQSGMRRSAVRARLASHALYALIEQSSDVIVAGHACPDMDSIGAALGIYNMARVMGKRCKIILDENPYLIQPFLDRMEENAQRECFLSPADALHRTLDQTLLVMVDTQLIENTACPKIFQGRPRQVVIIDHHRRGTRSLEDAAMYCLEPGASSACELVSELVQHFNKNVKLPKLDAEALLSGIYLDTKSFSINTNARTFEAAAYLRRQGADTVTTRAFLCDDLEAFKLRAKLIESATLLDSGIVYVAMDRPYDQAQLVASQTADALVAMRGVRAAFVLYYQGETIMISARSLGEFNVQLVMEALGGGGHLYMAGARLVGVNMQQACKELVDAARAYA